MVRDCYLSISDDTCFVFVVSVFSQSFDFCVDLSLPPFGSILYLLQLTGRHFKAVIKWPYLNISIYLLCEHWFKSISVIIY